MRSGATAVRTLPAEPHRRHRLVLIGIAIFALLLGGRLIWVQGLNSAELSEKAVQARTVERTIPALRGDILDTNGNVMATSVLRYDIWVDQRQVGDYRANDDTATETGVKAAAKQLAPLTGMSVADLEKKLTGKAGFQYIIRNVEPSERDAIMALDIPGIGADRATERIYPGGMVGANVVGFVSSDGQALGGTELSWDEHLRGQDGHTTYERGAGGQVIPSGSNTTKDAVDGQDVVLTIDEDIQHRAQEIITAKVKEWNGTGGSIVVIDTATGDIVALAEDPTFDPNQPAKAKPDLLGNQSISNVFEPGSTGKLFTMAAALEEGVTTPSEKHTVPYSKEFKGHQVRDSHQHPTQYLTTAGVLKESSNVGTVEIANRMSPKTRYEYLRKFGLGQPTGLPLPGESGGILHKPENWTGRTEFTTSFGQGYAVNAVQVTSAVGTFANDGVHVRPRIVKGVKDAKGVLRPTQKQQADRVVSPETAATMRQLMDNDVPDNPDSNAHVPGFAVGGKTGTAQVPDGTYTASFIGMAPMDDPRYVIGVFVYGLPAYFSGNTVAAPAFADIMSYTLHARRVTPSGKDGVELDNTWK
ncbi:MULTISPECIES: peptidoglycan D,D-transpeptidase FtsI family protein [Helcobacillus]|uniref:Cell division protein FtsI (Penicillin-binding protein 3) n=1 Tax=Helcobacillus massiliensis TaxID=521392 RepID=A0A839QPC2_9MICO|nr:MULTISPECIES: penicillin-binding protein 2 [Helcobacillus]MBB3021832.1 cell division protein FtsI (penicillin-binding protein 3) [Helcobacillus massiliensis]MCG7427134.1 penicillin-binding protein 2 [Helcobacillus sp. ACRRO]MDK7742496.1 penicillin-binding protein 2 [Helcobacillus massiliensis]WOO93353.1 penicillin-binding protein 2 [Helcobacillus massiliensis]